MSTVLDTTRTQAFAEQALGIVNGGFLSLMLSVGHRTRLLDTLAGLEPATSDRIAAAAGLNERYVREWLGAMVTGRIVEYDPATRSYWLPREHAASLTRAAGPDNLAELAQIVAMLGQVESAIVDVFRKGGGVDYRAFERFHALMAESSHTTLEATLLNRTLPLVAGLVERLDAGIDVLDMGCGEGVAVRMMAQRFPRSRFVGVDLAGEAIASARGEAEAANLTNAQFRAQDAANFSAPAAFDFITAFDAIHDQAAPRRVLRAIREALRPGGVFLMADIAASTRLEGNLDNPLAPFLFTVSTMHCMTVSLAQGGEGLGACWGEEKARELLAEAGFTSIEVSRVEGDPLTPITSAGRNREIRLRFGGCAYDTVVAVNRRFHGPHVCQPCRGRREHCRCRTRRRIRHCEARRDDGANRRLAPPVIDALPAAGLFGLFTPRAPGGLEIDPVTFARVVEEVSTFDSAAGRAFQINTGAWWTSRMSAEGVAELYADGPDRRHSLLPSGLKKCRVVTESPGAVRWRAPSMIHVGR